MSTNRDLIVDLPSGQRVSIAISDASRAVTSTNNLVAYRPRFVDYHRSGLGALFLNMEGIFPCLRSTSGNLMCGMLTAEEDGFFQGRSFIQAADSGNTFRVFSSTSNIKTYGFALEGCAEFTSACFREYAAVAVFCFLPRPQCG